MKRTIGERLKKARKDAKIRQGAAAEKMEMSRPTLSAIEANKRLVWAGEITKFAEMYKVSANELLYGFSDELPEIEISEAADDQNVRVIKYSQLYVQLNEENQKNILEMMEDLLARQSI
ncbi:MAG: helix-turn-helix domain-containing protein [Bacillota bacterium]